jgi:DNA-binding CsgD family transcriptional regulator
MSRLSHGELERVLGFSRQLHACHDPAVLRRLTVRGLSELIGAERVTFEHFAPTVPKLWAVAEPDEPYQPWMWEIFLAHLNEHPAVTHYRTTGEPKAVKISDFVSAREWHRTQIYQRLYRRLGFEDQLGLCLGPRNREFFSVVLSRGNRNFSEHDRELLNLLRPQIAQAHANARALERLRRGYLQQLKTDNCLTQTAVLLDRQGRVRHCPLRARRWLRKYFGQSFQRNQLPTEIETWLLCQLSCIRGDLKCQISPSPLVRDQDGSRIVFRLDSSGQSGFVILCEEQTVPGPEAMRQLGLTRRQVQILLEVEKGKTNSEIAAGLFISPHTVRTHLDSIFDILGVTNRTAAVARLRNLI